MGLRMKTDKLFKILADPTRRVIIDELSGQNKQTFHELRMSLSKKHKVTMSRQAITKHLVTLESAGLVTCAQSGKYKVLIFDSTPLKKVLGKWVERM